MYSATLSLTSALHGGGWLNLPRPGKDPVPIVQEAGWAKGPVWTGAENLVPTGIRFPNRPARGESQYRLSYHGPRQPICLQQLEKSSAEFNYVMLASYTKMSTNI